ncbi:hypothetical protein E1B28_003448 [Marasmius oreades]|uniref:Uncharacterized protein n=1 Tax=Marasmius oreades TaxID=181124 RepID=A0A9P7RMM3_9AGAR|nr:uncharacterized protein E1B28_003448 [Marasmius oreades]KAG7085915.1 hypothetical protein E1B28_003448 [Marasmius oreades]
MCVLDYGTANQWTRHAAQRKHRTDNRGEDWLPAQDIGELRNYWEECRVGKATATAGEKCQSSSFHHSFCETKGNEVSLVSMNVVFLGRDLGPRSHFVMRGRKIIERQRSIDRNKASAEGLGMKSNFATAAPLMPQVHMY